MKALLKMMLGEFRNKLLFSILFPKETNYRQHFESDFDFVIKQNTYTLIFYKTEL